MREEQGLSCLFHGKGCFFLCPWQKLRWFPQNILSDTSCGNSQTYFICYDQSPKVYSARAWWFFYWKLAHFWPGTLLWIRGWRNYFFTKCIYLLYARWVPYIILDVLSERCKLIKWNTMYQIVLLSRAKIQRQICIIPSPLNGQNLKKREEWRVLKHF